MCPLEELIPVHNLIRRYQLSSIDWQTYKRTWKAHVSSYYGFLPIRIKRLSKKNIQVEWTVYRFFTKEGVNQHIYNIIQNAMHEVYIVPRPIKILWKKWKKLMVFSSPTTTQFCFRSGRAAVCRHYSGLQAQD